MDTEEAWAEKKEKMPEKKRDIPTALVLSKEDVDKLTWTPHQDPLEPNVEGVNIINLTRTQHELVGIVRFDPGALHPATTYTEVYRYFYVLQGSVIFAGREIGRGDFSDIPARVNTGIITGGPEGGYLLFTIMGNRKIGITRGVIPDEDGKSIGILTKEEIDKISGTESEDLEGITRKFITSTNRDFVGITRFAPGASQPPISHPEAFQCFYVLDGSITMDGHEMTTGAYAHFPAGVEFGFSKAGPQGATLFYALHSATDALQVE